MVFDVAGEDRLVVLALELGEQVLGQLAQGVHEDVEPTAVRHSNDELLYTGGAGALQQVVEHRDQRLAALEREALLPHVAGVQESLQALGRGEALEDLTLGIGRIPRLGADRLEPLLDPALLGAAGKVHVLHAQGAAVGIPQRLDDLAERRLLRSDERPGVVYRVHVRVAEVVVGRVELGDARRLVALQRIDVGDENSAEAVLGDELQHRHLLAVESGDGSRGARCARLGALGERFHDGRVRDVARASALQPVEVLAPLLGHRLRVVEVGLVQLLDEGRVGPEEIRIGEEFLHRAHVRPPGLESRFERAQRLSIGTNSRRAAPV